MNERREHEWQGKQSENDQDGKEDKKMERNEEEQNIRGSVESVKNTT